ncbi:MAG: hypothetical protein AAY43_08605 [Methanosarcina sp. 795]|nr:MAG: hypothetical protein AAY43_08605 [Methanosarcina sp. 795]
MSISVTESGLNGDLGKYLKNIILEDKDKICNYVELSAREILPITRRLFEEKVSLAYDFEISQIVEKEKHLIIYGGAGSGKTITLKWLSTVYARQYLLRKEGFVPIYVALDSYVKGSFYNYLKKKVKEKGISEADFKKLLEGKALLLLDGLDLLTLSDEFSPFDEVSDFISEYEDCRYVVASRPEPFDSLKSTFALSELEKLTDEKIRLFIAKNVPNKRQAKLLTARSLSEVHSKPVLRNPLLLYIWIKLSTVHMETKEKAVGAQCFTLEGSVPSNDTEIYQAFVSELFENSRLREEFFKSRNQFHLKISSDRTNHKKIPRGRIDSQELSTGKTNIENFLMNLSFELQCRNRISCKYSYALEVAERYIECGRSGRARARKLLQSCMGIGLLIRKRSEIRFGINRSFQEYFAALKLKACLESGMDISKTFRNPRWDNVIVLTSELVESGDELVNSIISSGNLDLVRLEAAKALGAMKVRKAIVPLLFALGDENRFVRKEAANALGQFESQEVFEPLIRIFKSGNNLTRQGAVRALGKINPDGIPDWISDRIFDFIDHAIKDEDKLVRREAAKALQNLSESRLKRAFESLIRALDSGDDEVRRLAAESLPFFDCEMAVSPLINALKSRDATVRRFAAVTLGRIRSKEALQPLIEVLVFDDNGSVKEEAAKSLGKIKSKKAVEPLIDALMDRNNEGRSGAAEALGRIKASNAVDQLIAALEDPDDFTRLAAAKALGRIKPKRSIEPLINTLYDWNRFVKAEAAGALKRICTKEDEVKLKALLDSENEFVANLAFEILEGIEMNEILKTHLWECPEDTFFSGS